MEKFKYHFIFDVDCKGNCFSCCMTVDVIGSDVAALNGFVPFVYEGKLQNYKRKLQL